MSQKIILVLGATGAQGSAIIDKLLAPADDGTPSPYFVRALTRDVNGRRAIALKEKGVECVQGSTDDLPSILSAMEGAYGVWANTDGFTIGEQKETYVGLRLFELAKQSRTVRHYVWSNLDYVSKLTNYNPIYRCEHYDGKGRVADWVRSQPSTPKENGMAWSIVTSGPYMDMLQMGMFGPRQREDGTFVFATPVGNGHVPMIALSDLGFFARYTFDHRVETSGKELKIASEMVGWDYLVSTFSKVTGQKAEVLRLSLDEWFANFPGADNPVANELRGKETVEGTHPTTWRENFSGWWSVFRDDVVARDMDWIKSIHPRVYSVERWMRENKYDGKWSGDLLKNAEDGKAISAS